MKKRILAVLLTICMGVGISTPGEFAFAEENTDADEVENESVEEATEEVTTEEVTTEEYVFPTGLEESVCLDISDVSEEEIYSEASLVDGMEIAEDNCNSAIYDSYWDKFSTNYIYNQLSETERAGWDALNTMCLSYLLDSTADAWVNSIT